MPDPPAVTAELPVAVHPTVAVPVVRVSRAPAVPRGPGTGRRRRRRILGAVVILLAGVLGWRTLSGPTRQPGAWGGHDNGRIPAAELCPLAGAPGHLLRCDAAAAYGRMAVAYRASLKARLCITDSYRTYEAQVAAQQEKPALAAKPGTSNHGWALAVDLCGGANDFGTRQHRWLQANAGRFGWRQPAWAGKGGNRPEPWHWEFGKL
ncbi:MAG: M15 family metallopeptidase [Acidimicrobiales bacterium]